VSFLFRGVIKKKNAEYSKSNLALWIH